MKKDYTLYYGTTTIEYNIEDISKYQFDNHAQMIDFMDNEIMKRNGYVWVLSKDELEDVFISRSILSIQDFLKTKQLWQTKGDYHLFECEDLDEAYSLAADIAKTI